MTGWQLSAIKEMPLNDLEFWVNAAIKYHNEINKAD
jgi:hypothetical protein